MRKKWLLLPIALAALNLFPPEMLWAGSLPELRSNPNLQSAAPTNAEGIIDQALGIATKAATSQGGPSFSSLLDVGNSQLASFLSKAKYDERLPEWLRRVDIGARVGTGTGRYYIETVQPLWQTEDYSHTIFIQPRIKIQNDKGTYSAGLGYRKALLDNTVVLGVNTFYDYTDQDDHARVGGGAEILTRQLEFRWNIYEPTSNARLVENQANGNRVFDTAVAGYDLELGGPAPYFPDLKLYGKHQAWDFKAGKDLIRDGGRAELYLTSFLRIDAEAWYDSYVGGWAQRIGIVFRGDFGGSSGAVIRGAIAQPYAPVDIKAMTLHRVVREFDIITERTTKTSAGTVTVSVSRGS